MTWLDDLARVAAGMATPPPLPSSTSDDEGPNPIPENPSLNDCRGDGGYYRKDNDCSASFSSLNIVTFDASGIQWAQNYPELCACMSASNGPLVMPYDPAKSVPYTLRVQAFLDAGLNNDWVGYYISTGNAVLVDIRRAKKYGMYNWLCPNSAQRPLTFLVTKEPDVVYEQCRVGGQYAVLGIYWPLYQAAQQRAGGVYGFGGFSPPRTPNVPAIPVPQLPAWFGTIPMPKAFQPWVATVVPGYTKPTEQEVADAKAKQSGVGIGTIAAVAAGLAAIAYLVWIAKQ